VSDPREEFRLIEQEPVAGTYWVGGINVGVGFHLRRRPRWWHRLMMRWAFGWQWQDESA
jgi:hypothetical protein